MSLTKLWTIEGFESLTKQQLFDMSAAHLLKTRQKSANATTCKYGGSGCGASPFLKPEFIDAADEGTNEGTGWLHLFMGGHVPAHLRNFVSLLQDCHDRATTLNFMAAWKRRMTLMAERFGLSNHLIEADEANERA